MMEAGFRLKRAALLQQHPDVSEEERERMYQAWLVADD